jgi:hypothetical protein
MDLDRIADILCWSLGQADPLPRGRALYAALRFRDRFTGTSARMLDEALQRFDPPPTVASVWIQRIARLPAVE